ncbi:hypothetical protein XENORESO_019184 [Xenotaenia resolanae]|uniref:Uncharacterized protein n=1 Tax=Xenotaenia resolanae TaxID=208358 RepID=A0ABV0WYE0_9TELE
MAVIMALSVLKGLLGGKFWYIMTFHVPSIPTLLTNNVFGQLGGPLLCSAPTPDLDLSDPTAVVENMMMMEKTIEKDLGCSVMICLYHREEYVQSWWATKGVPPIALIKLTTAGKLQATCLYSSRLRLGYRSR